MQSNQPLDNERALLRGGGGAKALDVSTSSSASTSGELPSEWERESDDGEVDERDALLLAHVSELLAQMFAADRSDNNNAASEEPPPPRERFLRTKLAQALVELSATQTDLQLAASAGKELLEQLGEAKDEASELLDHLHACQQQVESVETENATLAERQQHLERELLQLREGSRGGTAHADDRDLRDERVTTPAESDDRSRHRDAMAGALKENNELKRRCLELERQQGARRRETEELERQHDALRTGRDELRLGCDAARRELEDLGVAHAQLRADYHAALGARDNLRLATRRLQSERDALAQKLESREALVASLESGRRAAGTHAQVLENRAARLRADNEELQRALAVAQEQQPPAPQSPAQSVDYDNEHDSDGGSVSLQQHARDLESLLDEAQRSLAALKLENRALRRHQMQQLRHLASRGPPAEVPLRRTKSMAVTCADILAADACSREALAAERPTSLRDDAFDASAPPPRPPPNSPLLRLLASPRRRRRTLADSTCNDKVSLHDQQQQQQQRPCRTTVVVGGDPVREDAGRDGDAHMDKAPLYLGLSVIACATAAAGLLSRR